MNNNSSKQILLSIVGVAILVIAVVGVSFAFFTYTRTGGTNNQITTGVLAFNFTDGNQILLTNHFPIMETEGMGLQNSSNQVCTFTITGKTAPGESVPFEIFVIPGADASPKTLLKTSEVYLNIRRTDSDPNGDFTGVSKYTGALPGGQADPIGDGSAALTKLKIGDGSINGAATVTMTFEVRMWVAEEVVALGDASLGGKGPDGINGTPTYTPGEYAAKYYSMKILVEAAA